MAKETKIERAPDFDATADHLVHNGQLNLALEDFYTVLSGCYNLIFELSLLQDEELLFSTNVTPGYREAFDTVLTELHTVIADVAVDYFLLSDRSPSDTNPEAC